MEDEENVDEYEQYLLTKNILDDYELCGQCGYDHSYEYELAYK